MILTNKISSKVGYVILTVAVAIFLVIAYVGHLAQVQADILVDLAIGSEY
jgi:hypothetical protein